VSIAVISPSDCQATRARALRRRVLARQTAAPSIFPFRRRRPAGLSTKLLMPRRLDLVNILIVLGMPCRCGRLLPLGQHRDNSGRYGRSPDMSARALSQRAPSGAQGAVKPKRIRDNKRPPTWIDKRGRVWLRIVELQSLFVSAIEGAGAVVTPIRRMRIEEAAELKALAEKARGDYLRDGVGSLDEVIRCERNAAAAVVGDRVHRDGVLIALTHRRQGPLFSRPREPELHMQVRPRPPRRCSHR